MQHYGDIYMYYSVQIHINMIQILRNIAEKASHAVCL